MRACLCARVFASLLSHRFDPRAFRWVQTMRLAVEEINESTRLLPNHTLGYKIFDSCAYPLTGQRAALAVLNGLSEADSPMCSGASPMLAVIGESGSAQSIVVSRLLQPFRIPMVTASPFLCTHFNILRLKLTLTLTLRSATSHHAPASPTEECIPHFSE